MGKTPRRALLLSAVCACLALAVATTSSPAYATNFWTDSNLYFTIGRGMTQGLMPYRDLFDHKGPLIFLIYAAGALLSDTSFLGVFALEVLSLTAMLFFAWRTVTLYGEGRLTLLAIPVTALVTVCTAAFNQGGSAEEFCLGALSIGLYAALRCLRGEERPARLHAAFGAAMGWVLWIKYTDCGLFFGLGLCVLLEALCARGLRQAIGAALAMLAGLAAVTLPIAVVLGVNGVLDDMAQAYFIQNIFGYGGASMGLKGHLLNALAYLRTQSAANPAMAALAMAGCVFAMADALGREGRGRLSAAAAAPLGAGLLLLFCYWGELAHPYYALVFAALVPLGLIPLGWIAGHVPGRASAAAVCISALLILPVCRAQCAATPLLQVRREDMPQTAFAAIMREEDSATLLDLTSLDQGFYLASGITPTCRYFANNNLNTQEKRDALDGYLAQGRTMFVVSCWEEPGDNYELIAEQAGVFDLFDRRVYKLYRRVEDRP
ncbi:MAG: hypothetical protein ACI4PG_05730 [Candidatus Ventricola sp.]